MNTLDEEKDMAIWRSAYNISLPEERTLKLIFHDVSVRGGGDVDHHVTPSAPLHNTNKR